MKSSTLAVKIQDTTDEEIKYDEVAYLNTELLLELITQCRAEFDLSGNRTMRPIKVPAEIDCILANGVRYEFRMGRKHEVWFNKAEGGGYALSFCVSELVDPTGHSYQLKSFIGQSLKPPRGLALTGFIGLDGVRTGAAKTVRAEASLD